MNHHVDGWLPKPWEAFRCPERRCSPPPSQVYEKIQNKRKVAWDHYFEHLGGWAAEHGVQLPTIPAYCEQSYHNFYMLLPTAALREVATPH